MNDVSLSLDRRIQPTLPTARHPGLVLLTLSLAILVAQIDTAVVNLATRPIGVALDAGVAALQWVLDSYNLVYAVLLLSGGLLADLFGRRRIFITGAALFTAASLACGVAPSIGVLIAGRAVAGVGAALMIPSSPRSSASSGPTRVREVAHSASGLRATASRWRSGRRWAASSLQPSAGVASSSSSCR